MIKIIDGKALSVPCHRKNGKESETEYNAQGAREEERSLLRGLGCVSEDEMMSLLKNK